MELRADLELATEAKAVLDVENSTPYLTLQSQFSIIQLGKGGEEEWREKRVICCRKQPAAVVVGGAEEPTL